MFAASWGDLWASFRRSWVHSTGMQLATLATLSAAYFIVAFALTASVNLKRILSIWGDTVEIAAYLSDSDDEGMADRVREKLKALPETSDVAFVSREQATDVFRAQMESYAPDLLSDKEFANPFPASFRVKMRGDSAASVDSSALERVAAVIKAIDGVEDVSYGQSWVKNYASVVRVASASGWALAIVLGAGAIFVVGNSIRASISSRRDEIEILELVGATRGMIRAPYVFEGAAMGLIAALIAVAGNAGMWAWESDIIRRNSEISRLIDHVSYLSIAWSAAILAGGAALGAAGAYWIVRSINDGWAASQASRTDREAAR